MAPLYLLTWTPRQDDPSTLGQEARWATARLWEAPERISSEGKALLAAKVQEWWATSESAEDMMWFLRGWAQGEGSPEHREVVRLLVLCVRTVPDLTDKDRQALDLLEALAAGGEDQRKKAYDLAESMAVQLVTDFAQDLLIDPALTVEEVTKNVASSKKGMGYKEAKAEHKRFLADLIRQAMPLPPVVT
jgi:hypothetical protein